MGRLITASLIYLPVYMSLQLLLPLPTISLSLTDTHGLSITGCVCLEPCESFVQPLVGQLNRLPWDLLVAMCLDHISIPTLVRRALVLGRPCLSGNHTELIPPERLPQPLGSPSLLPGKWARNHHQGPMERAKSVQEATERGMGALLMLPIEVHSCWHLSGGTSLGIRIQATLPTTSGKVMSYH